MVVWEVLPLRGRPRLDKNSCNQPREPGTSRRHQC